MIHVAVVGGGPAGAWTAYQLARRGARVTIFDGSHPREKPCGGGVTGRALAMADDAIRPLSLPLTEIRRARFVTIASADTDAIVDLQRGALAVANRTDFDTALLEAACRAGATLCAARVLDLEVAQSSVVIRTREGTGDALHRADAVVGADGANSLVRRRTGRPFRRDQLSIATGYFAHGLSSDEIVIEMTADPPGYIWSFPRADHLAIGICVQADAGQPAEALRSAAERWMRETKIAGDAPLKAYSWPIPSLTAKDLWSQVIAGPRWCLVGDAAGLVDPITREGIYFALASGEWAAAALSSSRDFREAADRYRDHVMNDAYPELARAARVKAAFFRPSFTRLMIEALRASGSVRSVMADLIAGTQSYRTLKWRLLKTCEFGLASRTLRAMLVPLFRSS
jgi:geranylgeranyl reductase family protein